jgi:drug/metabolite transporter (DMT)-like permease
VLAGLVAYFLYVHSVEIIGASRTGAFIHLIPFLASIMAITLLGEQPTLHHANGFGLILCGVWLANRGR